MFKRVDLLLHPRNREAPLLAQRIEKKLRSRGVEVGRTQREHGRDRKLGPSVDLLVAIGGDGTVLRAQRLAVERDVPVLGVGAGRLGFLAEIAPQDLDDGLERLVAGAYRIEERSLIEVLHERSGGQHVGTYTALNDAVLARGRSLRSLWIAVTVDGVHLANYVADGIIAATATGSTAYSLAAGGPILTPELRNIVLTPIAAHLSVVQSLILSGDAKIGLSLVRSQDAQFSVDGQLDVTVSYGDKLTVTMADTTAKFIRVSAPSRFYTELVARLQHDLDRMRGPSGTETPPQT